MAKFKKITEVELFYIQGNCMNMSVDEIAQKLNTNKENIIEIYEKTKKQKSLSFQTYSGTVAMTASQSSKDDTANNLNENQEFMKKYKNNIHKI